MIRRGPETAQDTRLAPGTKRGFGKDLLKVFTADAARARITHQQTTGIQQAKPEDVDVAIGPRSAFGMYRRRSELWRIENDQVEASTLIIQRPQFIENVRLSPFGTVRVEMRVERQIFCRHGQRGAGRVDRQHAARTASQRLQRKCAAIAEAVERRTTCCEDPRQHPVVALIKVKTRLVASNDVDTQAHAVLDDGQRLWRSFAIRPAGDRIEPLQSADA